MIGLHRHSHYSKRDAIAKIPDIVRRTAELGQKAWALTDHGTTSGLMEAYLETQKYNRAHDATIKFIFGVEAYWTPTYDTDDRRQTRHLILLAKNQIGYRNLLRLVTIGHGDKGRSPNNFHYTMRLTTDAIAKHSEGLIVTSACRGGILADSNLAELRAQSFKDIFADDFYIEIQSATDAQQREYNLRVLRLAEKLDLKVIVTEDSHYVRREDAQVHRRWLALDKKDAYYPTDDFYLHSDQEIVDALSYIPDIESILQTTESVAAKCEQVEITFGEKHFPVVDIGSQNPMKAVVDQFKPFLQTKLYARKTSAQIDECRLRTRDELAILKKCEYLEYFLINAGLIRWCRSNGIEVGRGRGSVCGSFVAYLMDITRVDPMVFNLFFERFANPERISPPDIDTDVPNSKRSTIIAHLKETYREVYHVRTFGTMADKAAIQRAAKALGYSLAKTKSVGGETIDDVTDGQLKELAASFVGVIQHFGMHASALIIFPTEAENFCAIERQGGEYICAYQFTDLERMGLLKLDLLGMKVLDTVSETVRLVKHNHGIDIDLDNLPFDDPKTFSMLRDGDTLGCFQIESAGMKRLIKKLKPRSLFDLVPIVALFRPSTIQSGVLDDFIERSRMKARDIPYIHPALEPILRDTFGVLLYQEQAMQIVQCVAGYSLAKADVFRRAIGHKDNQQMEQLLAQFVLDGQAHGFDEATMLKLAEWLKNCAAYQFNKSHSAAYALLAYQTAYLKANYPVEFLVAFLNSHHDDKQDDLLPYLRYATNKGITILPPDVTEQSAGWIARGNAIVTAVNFIKGIGNIPLPLDKGALAKLPKNKLISLVKADALRAIDDRTQIIRTYIRPDFDKQSSLILKKLNKSLAVLDGLFVLPEDVAKAEHDIELYSEQLQAISNEYLSIVNGDPAKAEADVLGFSISSPFDGLDVTSFDEPDPRSNDLKIVYCYVHSFKRSKDMLAQVNVETHSGRYFDLVLVNRPQEMLEEGSLCILSVEKNRIHNVLQKNVRKENPSWKLN